MSTNEPTRAKIPFHGATAQPDWSKAVSFSADEPPVLPMVCQDALTGQVLMVGYVSQEALDLTQSTGEVVFWSRSRKRLWKKGETSGHTLKLQRMILDCDGDAVLACVEPQGPTCHRNSTTCFDEETNTHGFHETDVGWSAAGRVFRTLRARAEGQDPESYTYKLLRAGPDRVLRKLGEECTEAILAAKNLTITGNRDEFLEESADLLYHWMVALVSLGVSPLEVMQVLSSREGRPRRAPVEKV